MSVNEEIRLLREEVKSLRELVNDLLHQKYKTEYPVSAPYDSGSDGDEENEENEENEERFQEEKLEQQVATIEYRHQCDRFLDKNENGMYNIGGLSISRLKQIQYQYKKTGQICIPKNLFDSTKENIQKIKNFMMHFKFM